VLVRTDSAGGTKAFTAYIADIELAYSVGFAGFLPYLKAAIDTFQDTAWIPAINAYGQDRNSACVIEITRGPSTARR